MSSEPVSLRPAARLRQRDIVLMLAPLALVPFLEMIGRTILSALMSRFETATDDLAGFGLGMGLYFLLGSPCLHMDQIALSLGKSRRAFWRVLFFALSISLLMALLSTSIGAIGPLSRWVMLDLQNAPDEAVASRAALTMLWFGPVLIVSAYTRIMRGALIRVGRPRWVTIVSASSRVVSILAALLLIRTNWGWTRTLMLPIAAYGIDAAIQLALYAPVMSKVVLSCLPKDGPAPSIREMLRFQYPLILTAVMMAISRPIVNSVIGELPDGKISLAALAVAHPLATLFLIVMGDIRVLPSAFESYAGHLRAIRRYIAWMATLSTALSLMVFATPVCDWILFNAMGVKADLAPLCRHALIVTCFFPAAIATRGYLQGIALEMRATQTLTWSGPIRLAANVGLILLFASSGFPGAVLGMLSMLIGFWAEGLVILVCLRRLERLAAAADSRSAANVDWCPQPKT